MTMETDPTLSGCCEIANIAGVTCRLKKYDSKYGYQCDDIEVSLTFFDQARIFSNRYLIQKLRSVHLTPSLADGLHKDHRPSI